MRTVLDYIAANWSQIVIPLAVLAFSLIALFWLKRFALGYLTAWQKRLRVPDDTFLVHSIRGPLAILCLVLSLYLGLAVSAVPPDWKNPAGSGLWTLFVFALALALLNIARGLLFFYGRKLTVPRRIILITHNVVRVVILLVAVLVVLDIWGVPTSPLLLFIAVAILVAILAFRDSVPNLFASFQIAATQEVKIGDYIKLDAGEAGYVTDIGWNTTRLRSLDGSTILVPNSNLVRRKVVNYGFPLKKAAAPFHFNTRSHLAELTGLQARNLSELVTVLKNMPDSVIYYHTHHFLEERQYLVPELSNDFAVWVKDALGDDVLSERLASISVFQFSNLLAFRDQMVNIIEDYLTQSPYRREVVAGREFYFMKSVSVILPTSYVAHDLREFVEALRKINPSTLYFHIFESRLRLGKEQNDFSFWLEKSMDEAELGQEIARIDPYTYTLEGLRSLLIQAIEKRIK